MPRGGSHADRINRAGAVEAASLNLLPELLQELTLPVIRACEIGQRPLSPRESKLDEGQRVSVVLPCRGKLRLKIVARGVLFRAG